jgi:isopenicillin-N N-acyltransferase-like protein
MIARYVSSPASPFDRGHDFGRANAEAVRGTIGVYERLFADIHGFSRSDVDDMGAEVADRVSVYAPELIEEINGIAIGADVPATRLTAINARTEILAGARPPECSVIGISEERSSTGAPILAQNWDWHPDVSSHVLLWTVQGDRGSFTTLTEAGILAKIGRNDRGVAVGLNIMTTTDDGGVTGTPVHLALRLLLQRTASWAEAESLVNSLQFSASSAITVAVCDPSAGPSALATFELSPVGIRRLDPVDGLLLHTNHFLDPHEGTLDTYLRDWPDTEARLGDLKNELGLVQEIKPSAIKGALSSHRAGRIAVCCHDADNPNYLDRQATLASVYMSLDSPSIEVAKGNPCEADYMSASISGLRSARI